MKESTLRSTIKALAFFCVKLVVIGYFVLHDVKKSVVINLIILALYFVNERVWSRIKWGYKARIQHPKKEAKILKIKTA